MKKALILFLLLNYQSAFSFDNQYDRIFDRIDHIERDLNILQKQFYRGTRTSDNKATEQDATTLNSNIETRVSSIEEQLRNITGSIEQVEHKIDLEIENSAKFREDLEFRLKELEENKKAENKKIESEEKEEPEQQTEIKPKTEASNSLGKVKAKDTSKLLVELKEKKDDAEKEFNAAFALLKAAKFVESEQAFKAIIAKKQNNEIIARSYYWIGEIYIAKKNYEQAAVNFLQSYKQATVSNKAPESLMKLVFTLRQLKKNKEACKIITKIRSEFSDFAKKSELKLLDEEKKLNCSQKS